MQETEPQPTAAELTEAAKTFASIGGKAGTGASKRRPHAHYVKAGKAAMRKRWKGHKKKKPTSKVLFTAKNGLIYRHGKRVDLPEADTIAASYGFRCAEEFVRHLEKKAK